jgi:Holliday junction resolvase
MKKLNKHLERDIEQHLVKAIAKLGGKAFKFSSANNRAVPDRLCIIPHGGLVFVELKATGKKPSPLQWKVINYLRELGQKVLVIDSKEMVDTLYEVTREELEKHAIK